LAQSQERSAQKLANFNHSDGLALQGYDAVAYHKLGKAIKGKKDLGVVVFEGLQYRFSSIEHKEIFKKDPESYIPKYGGWCAFAMGSDGSKVPVDPETFKIIDGKLYLFYNKFFNNTLKSWNKNETILKQQADIHWHKIYPY
jgi:hypothetical protein